jgi:hypothetical protein
MENPFLCESCRPLGYCRKHHKVASEKVMAEFDEAFHKRINSINNSSSISRKENIINSKVKLASLKQIRSLYPIADNSLKVKEQEKEQFVSRVLTFTNSEPTTFNPNQLELCHS